MRQPGTRHKLTAVGALTLTADDQVKEYFKVQRKNAATLTFVAFLVGLASRVRGKITVIWDGLRSHGSAARLLEKVAPNRFRFIRLPSYAPDLNPVEWLWSNTKYSQLAGVVPSSPVELASLARQALHRTRCRTKILKSFFAGAGLKL